ncbi:unnamed protein product [Penicillium pancosmium]
MSQKTQRFDTLPEDTVKSSKTKINISGFHVYLYGIDELSPQQAENTVVLFHVHGRTRTYKNAELFAHQFLHQLRQHGDSKKGFVVATFDNRNHGERAEIILTASFFVADGIALDIQTVMRYLKLYVEDRFNPTEFVMSGHSLGGHTAWNILADEKRIKTAIISVGSPNMTDLLLERLGKRDGPDPIRWPESIAEMYRDRDQRVSQIEGKQILLLNGALDTLVPSKFSVPWVEKYGPKNDVSFNVFEETGHWFSLEMMDKAVDWVLQKVA